MDEPDFRKVLGKRCKDLRREAGLSLMDMVRKGHSLSHYQKIERGIIDPQLSTLQKLARTFTVSVSEFLTGL
ncbi:helix-turn-helix transcriptional regulator [bacterium AH-315-F18]|nr:helix-turn-helix transcriptional regulator [bacterium AH-315-F18]